MQIDASELDEQISSLVTKQPIATLHFIWWYYRVVASEPAVYSIANLSSLLP